MARVKRPDDHRNTACLGRDACGDDVYECYGCARGRSRGESFRFILIVRRARNRRVR